MIIYVTGTHNKLSFCRQEVFFLCFCFVLFCFFFVVVLLMFFVFLFLFFFLFFTEENMTVKDITSGKYFAKII